MYTAIRFLGLIVLLVVSVFINSASSDEFTVMEGWLMGENCLKAEKTPCPVKEYANETLVFLTPDEQLYRLEKNGVEDWRLQKAYGQLIGVKGLVDGDIIKVTNIVQITGDEELKKA